MKNHTIQLCKISGKIINRCHGFVYRRIKIFLLLNRNYFPCKTNRIWKVPSSDIPTIFRKEQIDIFTYIVPHDIINWHQDYSSGHTYPLLRFDKLKTSSLFNKGVDVIFPWELSRCQFLIAWAQNFYITKNTELYTRFRRIILDWIENNPFLLGVNWTCAMDVSIRATNWIIACELFEEPFQRDDLFKKKVAIVIQQHADYIISFKGKRKNNHAVSHYAGLLFISLFLCHKKSSYWKKTAISGLEECMRKQVLNDGADCEFATCYHRLVLEMFSFSAILALANQTKFSQQYFKALFKMFEFTAAYIDAKGHAPQIGDNDSGRFLIFHDSPENDHSYLLHLGKRIFDYNFLSQSGNINHSIDKLLPAFDTEKISEEHRITHKSIGFSDSGYYFLKNKKLSVIVCANQITKNSITGHKHLDFGSFEVSYAGEPVFIDLGTYTYTRNLQMRNLFKGIISHNVSVPTCINSSDYDNKNYFGLTKKWPVISGLEFQHNQIVFQIHYGSVIVERQISILSNEVLISDKCSSEISTYLHSRMDFNVESKIIANDFVRIESNTENIILEKCPYSERYGHLSNDCTKIIFTNKDEIITKMIFK